MRNYRTSTILIFTITIIFIFIVGILIYITHLSKNNRKRVVDHYSQQTIKTIDFAKSINSSKYHQVAYDNAMWDEMYDFISNRDTLWAHRNLEPFRVNLNLDFMQVYDATHQLLFTTASQTCKHLTDSLQKHIQFEAYYKNRQNEGFYWVNGILFEVHGVVIRRSNDPQALGEPMGCLFAIKAMDHAYVHEFETLTETSIHILPVHDSAQVLNTATIQHIKPLVNARGKTVAFMHIQKKLDLIDQYNAFYFNSLYLIIGAIFLLLGIVFFVTQKWVNEPLRIIEDLLAKDSPENIRKLQNYGFEFVKMGQLFASFVHQKESLVLLKDKAEESSRLKTAFVSNMTHEIRTPLNGILGFSDLLYSESKDNPEFMQYSTIIKNCSDDLLRIMDDVMDISKIEAGQLDIRHEPFNINEVFEDLILLYSSQMETLKRRSLDLSFRRIPEPCLVNSDKFRLKQILINLVNNALKNTTDGKVEVTAMEENKFWVFSVKDTGIGINPEDQGRIFESFRQLEQSGKKPSGNGLGLSISRGLIRLMGGSIWLESARGIGSTFYVSIPADQ